LPRLAGSRFISFRSSLLTAIIWDFPAKNPQISLRETSDNRDVIFNRCVELLKGVSALRVLRTYYLLLRKRNLLRGGLVLQTDCLFL